MTPTVYVVDDDPAIRRALTQLLEVAGFRVEPHADGPAFLAACGEACAGCVLLDVAMPGMSGHEVLARLRSRGIHIPVVFLTGHGDVPMAVRSLQAGALDFLEKPIRSDVLLERVSRALVLDMERRTAANSAQQLQQRFARLTPRERQVMDLVVAGNSNKVIARELELSPRTVESHRTNVMHKIGVSNLAELVRIVNDLAD